MNFFVKAKGNQYKKRLRKIIKNFQGPLDWVKMNTLLGDMAKEVFKGTVDIKDYNEVRIIIDKTKNLVN